MKERSIFPSLSRRHLMQIGLGGAAMAVSGLAKPLIAQSKPSELLVAASGGDWGAILKKAYYDDYKSETGVQITPVPYKGLAELKALVEAKAWGQADVVCMATGEAAMAEAQGLTEPLDYGLINKEDLIPGSYSDTWMMFSVSANTLAWNTDAVPADQAPNNWADFFNPERKVSRSLWKVANGTYEIALLGAGVPLDKLYPLDLDKAFEVLNAVRDTIIWYEGGAQAQQQLVGGEADLAMLWTNRADMLVTEGKPVKFISSGCIMDGDTFVIPKGHPNKVAAMDFARYMAGPEPQARLSNLNALGPTNLKAAPLIKPEQFAKTPTHPSNLATNRFQDFAWLAEHTGELNSSFTKWLLG